METNISSELHHSAVYWFDPVPRDAVVLFYTVCFVYITTALYILAKHFIVPSLDIITAKTGATDSVAGCLIYGGATSLLGFLTAVIGAFVALPDNVFSINKIYGGHIYELTFLLAITIFCVPAALLKPLLVRPFMRDIVFVVGITIIIFLFFVDSQIVWYETTLLLVIFIFYLLAVRLLRKFMNNKVPKIEPIGNPIGSEPENIEMQDKGDKQDVTLSLTPTSGSSSCSCCCSCCGTFCHYLSLPAKIPLLLTIPSPSWKCCNTSLMIKLFPLTLIVSFVWQGLLSYLTVMIAMDWGSLVGLPSEITGFVIAPFSLELMVSIVLAERGDLPTAVHAILGRIIIGVCTTFGLSTFIYNTVFGIVFEVRSDGLYSLIVMLFLIIVLSIEVAITKTKLKKPWGAPHLILWFLHIALAIALTYEFIKLPI